MRRDGELSGGDVALTASQVAARLGIARKTWHAYVYRGYAPAPDAPSYSPKIVRWWASTVDEYVKSRKRQCFKREAG